MALTVFGIPSCGTVKKALSFLDDRGLAYTFVDLRERPPTRARVDAWVAALGARALRNTSGQAFRALGPEREGWSDEEWAAAFSADPMLVKRPVVEVDGRPVAVGFRDPEAFLAAIGEAR